MIQYLIKRSIFCAFLLAVVVLPPSLLVSSQMESQSIPCKPFDTIYPYLDSGWYWLDPDHLVFSVSDGLPSDAIGKSPSQWYQYQASSDKLDKLAANPFQTPRVPAEKLAMLKDLQPDRRGSYEGIQTSKSGNKFIYPRKVGTGTHYWFIDTQTGAEADLGRILPSLGVFWLPDESQFIVQMGPNSVTPIRWVSQNGTEITTKRLDRLPGINSGYQDSGLVVIGINPSGHYLLIQPEANEFWLYDIDRGQITKLDFYATSWQATWIGDSEFMVLTTLGVVDYDIQESRLQILIERDELNLDPLSGRDSISPDGRFLLYQDYGKNGTNIDASVGKCILPQPH